MGVWKGGEVERERESERIRGKGNGEQRSGEIERVVWGESVSSGVAVSSE